jgi:predicted nucleotidyltransferase
MLGNISMRLSKYEEESIKKAFLEIFKTGSLYLFGSRVDDNKKGGDIDLYIEVDDLTDVVSKKIDFLVNLKRKIGEQKIDVVINFGDERLIDTVAKEKGILLCKN